MIDKSETNTNIIKLDGSLETPKPSIKARTNKRIKRALFPDGRKFIFVILLILTTALFGINDIASSNQRDAYQLAASNALSSQTTQIANFNTDSLKSIYADGANLQSDEIKDDINIVGSDVIASRIAAISNFVRQGDLNSARNRAADLGRDIKNWNAKLSVAVADKKHKNDMASQRISQSISTHTQDGLNVPILMYHHTPSDFRSQLNYLKNNSYTTITLSQLVAAWDGTALPKKPVIITFDDGYEDQMAAYNTLQAFDMKATFYIITGGALSNWCIGAGRLYNLPQQQGGCGDAYLSWSEIINLDKSGLITIGAHTKDHLSLPSQSDSVVTDQIVGAKQDIEAHIGHSVLDFAYPYGAYNSKDISIVAGAGFSTAVSTNPGSFQSKYNRYSLYRLRSAYNLP